MNEPAIFISVDEARERILAQVAPLPSQPSPLAQALGLVAAADVASPVNVPGFDNSGFDGYALRADDVQGAAATQPAELRVVDELPAGRAGGAVIEPGTAARIMTGAPVPSGADAVVPFEDTDRVDWGRLGQSSVDGEQAARRTVRVLASAAPGENVRRAGGDVAVGDVVVHAGRVINAADIGVLGSVGVTEVPAHPRATVAILPTGDEIVEIDQQVQPGRIRNSNAWALEALAERHGAAPRRLPIVADTTEALEQAIEHASSSHLIVTIGGVSMGDYDLVKSVLASHGQMDFWQINMRPGKPLAFGTVSGTPLVGLPGNPVSSMVCFELFVRPAVMKMMGRRELEAPHVRATAAERMVSSGGKRTYVRVSLRRSADELVCAPTGDQSSFRLTSMTQGNGLAVVHEGETIEAGQSVSVHVLDESEVLRLCEPARAAPAGLPQTAP